jgi:hypothetical protein
MSPDYCPYRGLDPYTEEDTRFFFGREQDEKIIAANLFAVRLTVLYAGSGVGKTSVLRAGVIPDLRNSPHVAIVFFNTWQQPDFEAALKTSIAGAVSQSLGSSASLEAGKPLDAFVCECSRAVRGRIFLIFDQFEEYFLYHGPTTAEHGFEAELARLVNSRDIDAHVMLSLREDGLSKLDRFQGRIPNLLSNMLRLDHLDRKAAKIAICEPLRVYNETLPPDLRTVDIEETLVEALLADRHLMRRTENTMQSEQSLAGQEKFETPLLQLVLTRIWDEERKAGSNLLRLSTLRGLGGAERIVDRHLTSVMTRLTRADCDNAAKIFRFLVTPDGSKTACTVSELAGSAELPQEKVQRVVARLGQARILRTVAAPGQPLRYEIFHDVLGAAISKWRGIYVRRRQRQKRFLQAAVFGLLLLVAGMAFYWLWYLPWQARQPWGSVRVLSTGSIYDLNGDFAWLGRTTTQFKTQVSFTPRDVSRLHMLITRDWLALDVRSLYGSTVNAQTLRYGESRKLQPGDIIVLGGVAPMQFERAQLSGSVSRILGHAPRVRSKNIAIPGPDDWAILIDGGAKRFQYLRANPSFIGTNGNNGLVVENNPSAKSFLKASFELVPTEEGSTLRVLMIENIVAIAEVRAEWKSSDYDYENSVIPPNQPVETFPKKREREDLPDYTYVEKVALSYGDLPFQIVQIVSNVDLGGTVSPRPSSAR